MRRRTRRPRSTVIWVGVGLTALAFVLAIAWNFVPATVTHDGQEITCHPASVDRSSDPAEIELEDLACRPIASVREKQMIVGLTIALTLIWGLCSLVRRKWSRAPRADEAASTR